MFKILINIENKAIAPIFREDRKGDVRDSLADISKAVNLINYQPEFKFKEGLVKTYNWYKENQKFIKT